MAKKLYFETAEFNALNSEWTEKLKVYGFVDIENGADSVIVRSEILKLDKATAYWRHLNYSDFCALLLEKFKFKREIDRLIFQLHADGMSNAEIVTTLKPSYPHSTLLKVRTVSGIVQRIRDKFMSEY